jgi:hypothetical protein
MSGRACLAATMAVVLIGSACGGSDDSSVAGTAVSTEPAGSQPVTPGAPADPAAGPDAGFNPAAAAEIEAAAPLAITRFGDLPSAGGAVLASYDAGFSFDQIVTAIADGTLGGDGSIEGGDLEESLGVFEPVGFRPRPRDLDIELLREELAKAQNEFGTAGIEEAPSFFLELILHAARDGYPVEVIVEAIVFGDFTAATLAEMEARSRELLHEEVRDELEYCRMRGTMSAYTGFAFSYEQCVLDQTGQTVDELYGPQPDVDDEIDEITEGGDTAPGAAGLGANPVIPGPDGTISRESITLAADGETAALAFDIAFTTAVDYVDEAPVCFDDFTLTSGASDLTIDGTTVTGVTDVILSFDGGTKCPETEQDGIGVPQPVDITGEIDGGAFVGQMSFDGLGIPFSAALLPA